MSEVKTEPKNQFGPSVPPVWEKEESKPPTNLPTISEGPLNPIPIVKVYSTRGVEYGMMTIVLWVLASTLAWLLINLINGSKTFDYLVVPASALIVCVPVFGLLFLRLKRAELATPSLKYEPSKRRWSQLTQFVAFIVVLVNLIVFVYEILVRFGTDKKSESLMKSSLTTLVILVIAGGILTYYWFEEHRNK